jgi:phosphoserine aminotransferase
MQQQRVYNFSAGPAVLPEEVLKEAQEHLYVLPGVGMSVLEISHRSKTFDEIIHNAEALMRELLNVPENYHILFLQGGATLQFSMVPMNLITTKNKADYIITGYWSQKALKEAKKVGTINIAATTESENFTRIPKQSELKLDPDAAYVHYTSNNTIFGTQWNYIPEVGNVPLVCDMSSDFMCRPVDVSKFALIYAGAQKNIGPSGVTVVIIRKDMLERSSDSLPIYLNYKIHADNFSLYNTPNCFGIYIIGLVMKWIKNKGGLKTIQKMNEEKAKILYDFLDENSDYYRGTVQKDSRSLMNIPFRLPNEELENKLIAEATKAGFSGLKGHKSVGGLRASIYNAFPKKGVEDLVEFLKEFRKKN